MDSSTAWAPQKNDGQEFLQVDLGSQTEIQRIDLRGRKDFDQWTKSYQIAYGNTPRTADTQTPETYFVGTDGNVKTFTGNVDRIDAVGQAFSVPIIARYVRIYPKTFEKFPALRWEIYGCDFKTPLDCQEYYDTGSRNNGTYTIYPSPAEPGVRAYCEFPTGTGEGWTVFQRRMDGSVDFYRGWEEFKEGFGDVNGEYWLGNAHVHTLTNTKAFGMVVKLGDWEGDVAVAKYGSFVLSNETDFYRMTVGLFNGSIGDSLKTDYQFNTHDKGGEYKVCSADYMYEAGWWFGFDNRALLNGPYHPSSITSGSWKGLVWEGYKPLSYSLKATTLYLRRNRNAQ